MNISRHSLKMFYNACKTGQYKVVSELIPIIPCEAIKSTGLYIAAKNSHPNVASILINCGANVNYQRLDQNEKIIDTALIAAVTNNDPGMTELLLQNHAKPALKTKDWLTPLIAASKHRQTVIVQKLLRSGADVNQPDCYDFSPLMIALSHENIDVAKTLVESGADLQQKNACGHNALIVSAIVSAFYNKLESVKFVLQPGYGDINLYSKVGQCVIANFCDSNVPVCNFDFPEEKSSKCF